MNRIEVIKASGEKTIFKKDKLILSLKKAGASEEIATNILESH